MRYGHLIFDEPVPDTSRKILHVDMDAFYASVEMRDNPSIRNKPVVIAKHPNLTGGRGIVSTCNYKAREYGIHSAMSSMEAYRLCPQAVFVPVRMDYYRQVSNQIHEIFHRYTDLIEPVSLDEAYLDVTNNKINLNSATILAQFIQESIYNELSLTCSVGVSYNKFIAKICSDYNKPSGITVVPPSKAQEFLLDLSIDDFHGVGEKTLPRFHELGIHSGADLIEWELDDLMDEFGKMGYSLYHKVRGVHNSPVISHHERKSIGNERTFSSFLETDEAVLSELEKLTKKVVSRLTKSQQIAQTVTIKVRYEDFETITRQVQSPDGLQNFDEIYKIVKSLWFEHGNLSRSVRLLGVTVSNFVDQSFEELPLVLDFD